jgi:RimJ/RimL family protein N-acetyltransferase
MYTILGISRVNKEGGKMNRVIRQWRPGDAGDLALCLNNKKVLDNLRDGLPYPYTVKDAEAYISFVLGAEKDSQYTWAITVGDRAVGSIGVFRKDNIHRRTAEMGYYIAEPYWGRGIATCAVKQVCAYIFEQTDILRIFAEPFAFNTASCRVLEKAGFVLEGTMRKNAVKNGQVLDMKMYSIVRD